MTISLQGMTIEQNGYPVRAFIFPDRIFSFIYIKNNLISPSGLDRTGLEIRLIYQKEVFIHNQLPAASVSWPEILQTGRKK